MLQSFILKRQGYELLEEHGDYILSRRMSDNEYGIWQIRALGRLFLIDSYTSRELALRKWEALRYENTIKN